MTLVGRRFKASGRELRLPAGEYEVVHQGETHYVWGKGFSDLKVRNVLTGKEFSVPTGNAQLIFGLYD